MTVGRTGGRGRVPQSCVSVKLADKSETGGAAAAAAAAGEQVGQGREAEANGVKGGEHGQERVRR